MEKLNREQMVELVGQFQRGEIDDDHASAAMEKLERSSGDPGISDLIFYPSNRVELTAEEIVDRALRHRPIEL